MSFSGDVKEELLRIVPSSKHCRIAELAALWPFLVRIEIITASTAGNGTESAADQSDAAEQYCVQVASEGALSKKFFTLIRKTTIIKIKSLPEQGESFRFFVKTKEDPWKQCFDMLMLETDNGELRDPSIVNTELLERDCCRRAYLRGMFLATGSMSDPEKEYHLEFVCGKERVAKQIREVLHEEGIEAKIVQRKKHDVVYIKDSAEIVDLLNLMGAHAALMNMENSRILKEIANNVNRQVNCETSNIMKTVTAAKRQIEDIEYIETHGGMGQLPASLRTMAEIRLENRDATLSELGELMTPPVGKSGINHRLRRLSEIADRMRMAAPSET